MWKDGLFCTKITYFNLLKLETVLFTLMKIVKVSKSTLNYTFRVIFVKLVLFDKLEKFDKIDKLGI